MARSIDTIYNEIITEKENTPALASLTSVSQTAIWRHWAYVTAVVMWALEKMWDTFSLEVDDLVAKAVPGIPSWYARKVREFQYGDNLQFINDVPGYAAIDPVKQIVKRVSVTSTDEGEAIIKVAKVVNNNNVALSNEELTAVRSYVNQIQFAGSAIRVSSLNTDYLKLNLSVYYNPLFDLALLKTEVEAAINLYLSELPFDGVVVLSRITDAVQKITGVQDVVLSSAQARTNTGSFGIIARTYQTAAGYIQIDPDQALSTTIQYLPNL